jgi:hypothetical protein
MSWKFWQKQPMATTPPNVNWVGGDPSFRAKPDLVAWARKVLMSPEGQELQAFLFSDVSKKTFYRGDAITGEQALMEYGRLTGYLECLAKLQEAAVQLPRLPQEIEVDYSGPQPGDDQQE